nr:Iron-sulfur cluster assembly protein [Candidatus Pantoea persica]
MTISVSAWLQQKIDNYKFSVRDITVDFYLAQAKLNRADCSIYQLRQFNDTCLDMAEIRQINGDDQGYLHAMGKLHHRLVQDMGNN